MDTKEPDQCTFDRDKFGAESTPCKPAATGEAANDRVLPARVESWRAKLLDMSRRNKLLNFKDSKNHFQIAFADVAALEDGLADGSEFSVAPATDSVKLFVDPSPKPPINDEDVRAKVMEMNKQIALSFVQSEFEKRRLHSFLEEKDLNRRLLELFRQVRNDMEEGGIQTLYLTLGSLYWRDAQTPSGTLYRAPLALLPVRLSRLTAKSNFSLRRTDEDPVVNVTLLEMLKREHAMKIYGLDPLPTDDKGIDFDKVFAIFDSAISPHKDKGWHVSQELWLGRFSFSKIIMWEDLGERIDQLRESKIVAHLVSGVKSGAFDDGVKAVAPADVDAEFPPKEVFCPMSADSSQLAAVLSAERGKSFVLHGPPGTGKSQTITNLIANLIGHGKTVLFVAEKRAALEVVQRRLARLGLGPFLLELHSNKSGKQQVLQQLREAMDFAKPVEPRKWDAVTDEIAAERAALTKYVRAMHTESPCGLTPYDAISRLSRFADTAKDLPEIGEFSALDQDSVTLEKAMAIAGKLTENARDIEPGAFRNLTFCRVTEWSPAWENSARNDAKRFSEVSAKSIEAFKAALAELGLSCGGSATFEQVAQIAEIARHISDMPVIPGGLFASDWDDFSPKAKAIAEKGAECKAIMAELDYFDFGLIDKADVSAVLGIIQANKSRNMLSAFFSNTRQLGKVRKCMNPNSKQKLKAKTCEPILAKLARGKFLRGEIAAASADDAARLGSLFAGLDTNFDLLGKVAGHLDSAMRNAKPFAKSAGIKLAEICDGIVRIARSSEAKTGAIEALEGIASARQALNEAMREFAATMSYADDTGKAAVAGVANTAEALLSGDYNLRNWSFWNQARNAAVDAHIGQVPDAIEAGVLNPSQASAATERGFCSKYIGDVMNSSDVIREFYGPTQDGLVDKFGKTDDEYADVGRKIIIANQYKRLNAMKADPQCSAELSIIRHECEKKMRHKPVRTLLELTPKCQRVLKPCFLMSPLSVAQYLPPSAQKFDLVVFDEASQVTTWDAVGAMARGNQVIIVGDPKQLPPTSFFQKQFDSAELEDEENADAFDDLESILDECIADGLPSSYLAWHYRSRHESLIAFSNKQFYESRLFTFPSSDMAGDGLGVSLHMVQDGVYDRKNTRTNRKEAEAIVAAAVERMLNPAFAGKSAGIVTFSQAQQELIDDLIEEERRKHPEIEKFFSDDVEEPFFVKNLENVQGDERDAIFFSICYGKDSEGKFTMNFGPLNKSGGGRRLNVAVTRAKEQVVVFSSIAYTDIDADKTQSDGPALLREFLKYAESGNADGDPARQPAKAGGGAAGGIEAQIAQFLRDQGYLVDAQVGFSKQRIDVAARKPDAPGKYVLGIECDGPGYRDSASVRDRDKLRAAALKGLGWKMMRVWSLSWWLDRKSTERRILAALGKA